MILSTARPSFRVPYLEVFIFPPGTQTLARSNLYLSPLLVGGSSLIYASAYLRVLCFHTLGRYFTFELSLRKEHKLITEGPYSIVRHPSYLAATLGLVGMVAAQLFSPGTWWMEAHMWSTWQGKVFGAFWVMFSGFVAGSLLSRVPIEDLVLRTEFKSQWVSWAERTPYAVIPFIW